MGMHVLALLSILCLYNNMPKPETLIAIDLHILFGRLVAGLGDIHGLGMDKVRQYQGMMNRERMNSGWLGLVEQEVRISRTIMKLQKKGG